MTEQDESHFILFSHFTRSHTTLHSTQYDFPLSRSCHEGELEVSALSVYDIIIINSSLIMGAISSLVNPHSTPRLLLNCYPDFAAVLQSVLQCCSAEVLHNYNTIIIVLQCNNSVEC